jgi:cell pole-organizing protein PopZ
MTEAKAEQEPSIEEILESIRQIISDDAPAETHESDLTLRGSADSVADGRGPDLSVTPAPQPAIDGEEVFDLTERVDVPSGFAPTSTHVEDGAADLDLSASPDVEASSDFVLRQPVDSTVDASDLVLKGAAHAMDGVRDVNAPVFVSDVTAAASTAAMAKLLDMNIAVEKEDFPARIGPLTLEDMARDLMKPLIKVWLDQNLPRIVEAAVAREVEKLARRVLDK